MPLRTNGFQDRLVMTTSIQLHVSSIQLYVTRNISSGGTFGGTSKVFSNGRTRKVLILLAFHRLDQTRSTGFQDRLVMTTSIQLRVPEYFTVFLLGFQQFHVEGLFSASFTRLYLHLNTATPIIIAYPAILKETGISCRKRMPRSAANTT